MLRGQIRDNDIKCQTIVMWDLNARLAPREEGKPDCKWISKELDGFAWLGCSKSLDKPKPTRFLRLQSRSRIDFALVREMSTRCCRWKMHLIREKKCIIERSQWRAWGTIMRATTLGIDPIISLITKTTLGGEGVYRKVNERV